MKAESNEKPITLPLKSKEEILKEIEKAKKFEMNQENHRMYLIPYCINEKSKDIHQLLIDFSFNFRYVGNISKEFNREFFGANYYHQNDIYIGEWEKNLRHGYGMYIYNYELPADKRMIYFGQFVNGNKEGNGLLIWKNSEDINSRLINEPFNAYLGKFKDGQFISGVFFSQSFNEKQPVQIAYIGKLLNNQRHDNEGKIINLTDHKVAYGKYDNNKHTLGYVVQYTLRNKQILIDDLFNFDLFQAESFHPYETIDKNQREQLELKTMTLVEDFNTNNYWNKIDSYYHKILTLASNCQYLEAFKTANVESYQFIPELKAFEEIYQFKE